MAIFYLVFFNTWSFNRRAYIDKFNTKKTAITVLVPLLLSVIILLLFDNIFLMAYMCLYGLNMGISAPFIGSLWAEIYGVKSLGTVKALLHAGSVFASAFGPLVFGYLIDWDLELQPLLRLV